MDKAAEIIKYADLDQLEHYIEYVEVLMDALDNRNQTDDSLQGEHEILSKRFSELLGEPK